MNHSVSTGFEFKKSKSFPAPAVLLAGVLLASPGAVHAQGKEGFPIDHFKGNKGVSINLEEFGPGVCVSDFDKDGWQDIYFVNGSDRYGRGIGVKNALYHNQGDGTFTDVTESAGVPGTGYGLGCV